MPASTEKQEKNRVSSATRTKIALSFFTFIIVGANDGAFGVVLPGIQAHYHADKATIGLLFLTTTAGYLLGSFNNGPLLEKLGRQRFLILGALAFLLGAGIISLMPPFPLLLPGYLVLGCGISLLDPGLNAYITSLPRSTSLLNYLHAFYGVGAWLGPLLASAWLTQRWSWNGVYMVWGSLCLLALLGFGLFFRGLDNSETATDEKASGNVLWMALRLRVVWLAALFLLVYVGAEVSLGNWSFSFLTEERHGALLLSGGIVSGYWFGLTLGRVTLAHAGERIGNRGLIQLCLAGVVLGLLLVWFVPYQPVSAFGLLLTGFCLGPIFPTTIALMPDLVPARLIPSAIGFLASLSAVGGSLCPWIAGNLAERIGLWTLLPFVIVLTGGMLCLWLALQRRPAQGDMEMPPNS
jgi:fucose permease